jgi:hypothetical protein
MWTNPATNTALTRQSIITLNNSNFVGSSVIINTTNQLVGLTVETVNPVHYNWSITAPQAVQYKQFMIDESNIYIGSGYDFVIRNTVSGEVISTNALPGNDTVNSFNTVPLVIRGTSHYYFSGNSRIYGRYNNQFVNTAFPNPTSPVTGGTRIFFASGSNVYTTLFNLTSTETLFTTTAAVSADILVGSNGVLVPTSNGTLFFSPINVRNQSVSVQLGSSPLSKPAYVYDTTYIVGSSNCNVYWVRQTGGSLTLLGSNLLNAPITKPITTNGTSLAFVCTDGAKIYALNALGLKQEWEYGPSFIQCPAVFDDDSVYVATSSSISILRAKDGKVRTIINTGATIQFILVDRITKNIYTSFTDKLTSIDPTIYSIITMQ